MATVDDLAAFLLARIAEDEAVSRRNLGTDGLGDDGSYPDYPTYITAESKAADDLLKRFTPPRLLAGCEAKKRIVERCRDYIDNHCSDDLSGEWLAEQILVDIGLPYASHPAYRPEWAPDS